jgi:hypothetical protein
MIRPFRFRARVAHDARGGGSLLHAEPGPTWSLSERALERPVPKTHEPRATEDIAGPATHPLTPSRASFDAHEQDTRPCPSSSHSEEIDAAVTLGRPGVA